MKKVIYAGIFIIVFLGFVLIMKTTNEEKTSYIAGTFKNYELQIEKDFKELQDKNDNVESYALLSGGGWGGNGHIIITIDGDNASVKYVQNRERYKIRNLSSKELKDFLAYIDRNSVDTLKPLDFHGVFDGIEYLYVHQSKEGIEQIYINNPESSDVSKIYSKLVKEFESLAKGNEFKVHYEAENKYKSLEVMIEAEKAEVISVWKKKNDTRILIREANGYKWHQYNDGNIGKGVNDPLGFTTAYSKSEVLEGSSILVPTNDISNSNWNGYFVQTMSTNNYDLQGIWLTQLGKKPVLIKEGIYSDPVVIPNSDWVIVAKADQGWDTPNTIVKINLKTKIEFTLDIKPEDTLVPVAYIPEHKKLLIVSKNDNSDNAQYLFYDVKTDGIEKVNGNVEPLLDMSNGILQASGNANEYWAATSDYLENKTVVGLYNAKKLEFKQLYTFEGIIFDSMNCWVDYGNKLIYVVANGDLLQVSLDDGKK